MVGLAAQALAFGGPAGAPGLLRGGGGPGAARLFAPLLSARSARCGHGVRMQEGPQGEELDAFVQERIQALGGTPPAGAGGAMSVNLEGHFRPKVGFMPHAFRTDGDFAAGDPRFALTYDAAAGGAETSVEVCGIGPTYEDFIAGFAPTSDPGWSVDPPDGTLDVKGGDPDALQVRYLQPCRWMCACVRTCVFCEWVGVSLSPPPAPLPPPPYPPRCQAPAAWCRHTRARPRTHPHGPQR